MKKYLEAIIAAHAAEHYYPNQQEQEWIKIAIDADPKYAGITIPDIKNKIQNLFRGRMYAALLMLDNAGVEMEKVDDKAFIDIVFGFGFNEEWDRFDELGEDCDYPNNEAIQVLAAQHLYGFFFDPDTIDDDASISIWDVPLTRDIDLLNY